MEFKIQECEKFVVVFGDELTVDELEMILKETDESGVDLLLATDKNTKICIKAPVLPADADIQDPLVYWFQVFEEVTHPCCGSGVETTVEKVMFLKDFVRFDVVLNPPSGNYPEFSELL